MSLYDEMQAVVKSILADPDFKQGVTSLVKVAPGTGPAYDPGSPVETSYTLDGAVRGVKFKYVAKSLAVASDLQITHAALEVEPEMTDFVIADGVRYKIVHIDRKPSVGVAVAYTLILRR